MTDSGKKLFLFDALALIYRAYFAFSNNHRINSKGLNTSAIFGFTNTLLEVLKKEAPTHLAVVFDTAAPTSRHDSFPAYKAHRQEIPEDLAKAIPYVIKLVEGFNIPVIMLDGFEADDIIGTLAKRAEQMGFTTYMMTPDKDYGQLVDENTFIYKPPRGGGNPEVMGVAEVCARWEIESVSQVIEILGLMGDAVDNIPGIPGVGEKTAIQLVKQFGTIENLLLHTDQLKGKLKEKVENNKELALQSKQLATIILDVPISFDEEHLRIKEPNKDALKELFADLEFRNIAQKVLGDTPVLNSNGNELKKKVVVSSPQGNLFFGSGVENAVPVMEPGDETTTAVPVFKTILEVNHHYELVDTFDKRKKLIEKLLQQTAFCFDTETTGLDVNLAELVGMSFCFHAGDAYYVPVPANYQEALQLVNEFKPAFENASIGKTGQNVKYDMAVLKWYDITIQGKIFDTMIAHFLIQPDMRHNMDLLAETYLNYSPVSIQTLIGKKGKDQLSMRDVPIDQIKEYAAEDADITFQLREKFEPLLAETGTTRLFEEIEIPLIPVLAAMEAEGINIDKAALQELSKGLEKDIAVTEGEIQEFAGTTFNVSSPKQVGEILFEILKISDKPQKTKTGQYATGEDVLSKLENRHPIVRKILDYRELVKLKNTYVDVLPEMVNPRTGRIHTSYNQIVAVTGRLSSDNPNLQNIPIRTERGREIRKAFIPRNEKYTLLSADYSQIELRIIAELSKDPGMLEAFISGEDIHAATASKVYGVALGEVTGDMRRNAKMVNFGIIYGISAFGLADRLNISRTEAKEIIENYFRQYPYVKDYMDQTIENARQKGFVETIMGRRRYLRDINSANATVRGFAERNAINAPIQGSAADMIKIAMINIHAEMKKRNMRSKMLLQVHDELVFDVWREETEELKILAGDLMKSAIKLDVPVEVSIGIGNNWLEAH